MKEQKDTGFSLWERKKCNDFCESLTTPCDQQIWKPIWVNNYNFKKYNFAHWQENIEEQIFDNTYSIDVDLYIERGTFHSRNGIGYETQEHLRGFIARQFNKDIFNNKNILISPSEWHKWYLNSDLVDKINKENAPFIVINTYNKSKWEKEWSLLFINYLIKENNWNIDIKDNHNIADSLLMIWYVINRKVG